MDKLIEESRKGVSRLTVGWRSNNISIKKPQSGSVAPTVGHLLNGSWNEEIMKAG
jgi:hypothetical protein